VFLEDQRKEIKKKLSANSACPMELRSIHSIGVTRAQRAVKKKLKKCHIEKRKKDRFLAETEKF